MKIDFWRADSRDLSSLATVQPRQLLAKAEIKSKVGSEQKARDTSQEIIVAGQASYWVSTALDPECKGQSKGNPVYKATHKDLNIYRVGKNGQLSVVNELQDAILNYNKLLEILMPTKVPHLVLDAKTIEGSSVIALLHAQSGDAQVGDRKGTAEVSFFTAVPGNFEKTGGVGT